MTPPGPTCDPPRVSLARFDVVIVPFPFTDRPVVRRRPALVVSATEWNAASGHVVAAMITSARQSSWPSDVPLTELAAAGLSAPLRRADEVVYAGGGAGDPAGRGVGCG